MRTERKKKSIRLQIAGGIFLSSAALIIFCFLMNSLLLERLYIRDKEKAILEAFSSFDAASEDGKLYDDDYTATVEAICAADNISVIVMSPDGSVRLAMQTNGEFMIRQLYDAMFALADEGGKNIIETGENYSVERRTDESIGNEYLLLWGSLGDGNTILIRTAIESMTDSARIANRLLLIAGIGAIALGLLAAGIISGVIIRPLRRLGEIAKRMAALDFSARYEEDNRASEIDDLGQQMNTMSAALEGSIKELKETNARLAADVKLYTENEAMRKEFISNVSHELKTPLALIEGYAEGLKEGVSDDEESRSYYCDVILEETEHMNRIVRQLLVLNQLEYGQDAVTMQRFDLVPLIRGVFESEEALAVKDGIETELALPEKYEIFFDEFMAELVVSNFLSNAIHYASGDKKIKISLNPKTGRLLVYNSGDAIPDESIDRIWEKFYKADKARSRAYGGSGIGLSVVAAIGDAMSASYGVKNLSDGVEFYFDFG